MKAQIRFACKLSFVFMFCAALLLLGLLLMPVLYSYEELHGSTLGWSFWALIWGGSISLGVGISFVLIRSLCRRIEPGIYTLGPGRGEGKKVKITVPEWVPLPEYDQLLHTKTRLRWKVAAASLSLLLIAYLVAVVPYARRASAAKDARRYVLSTPLEGRLYSIWPSAYPVDQLEVELEGREWVARKSQVILVYDEGIQELITCYRRLNQGALPYGATHPPIIQFHGNGVRVKLERLGRSEVGSGDNREIVKISLLDP